MFLKFYWSILSEILKFILANLSIILNSSSHLRGATQFANLVFNRKFAENFDE